MVYIYLAAVSLVSVIVTAWDKRVSKKSGHRRVPERVLLILAGIGGSVAMFFAMLLIRHKTKHPKFMVGLPAIMIAQYGLFFFFYSILK